MPLLHFTPEDARRATEWARQAALPLIGPKHGGDIEIRIEEAPNCKGIDCREGLKQPVRRHSHLIVRGKGPETRESIFAIFTE